VTSVPEITRMIAQRSTSQRRLPDAAFGRDDLIAETSANTSGASVKTRRGNAPDSGLRP